MSSFTAPSGNIACTLGEESVSCVINEHSFIPTDASCNDSADLPFTVTVGKEGQASGSCGAPFASSGASLSYGAAAKNDTFACVSTEASIECWSQVTGQGFSLSRDDAQANQR